MKIAFIIIVCIFSIFPAFSFDDEQFQVEYSKLMRTSTDSLFTFANELKDSDDEYFLALSDLYIGKYYDKNGINNKAINYYLTSLDKYEKLNFNRFDSYILSRIAANYRFLKDFKKAELYFSKAFFSTSDDDLKLKAKLLNQLGDIHRDLGKIDSAFHYYYESLKIAAGKDTVAIANNYNNLGDLWQELDNFDSSSYYYNLSLDVLKNSSDISEIAENFTSLALIHLKYGYERKAISYITKSIYLLEISSNYELSHAYNAAVKIYSELNMLDSLTLYLFKQNNLERKLHQETLSSSLLAIEIEQSLKSKEAENSILMRDNKVKNLTSLTLLAVSISVLIIGISLFFQIRRKKSENQLLTETNDKINKANEELKAAYDDIHELNATKDKFFSIISHDLKGPVSGMKLMLDMIIKDFEGFSQEELQEVLREFYGLTDNTLELLLTLLDWSRSQRGLLNLNFDNIQLSKISQKNIALLNKLAGEKSITLIDNTSDDLFAEIDHNTIDTVYRNIISNAIKFTRNGGNINIGAGIIDDNTIEVFVKDSGIGIPEYVQMGLFKVGDNKSTPGTNDEKGTGLGLILCKDFVEKNSGTIRFVSIPNEGTTFFFTLPMSLCINE